MWDAHKASKEISFFSMNKRLKKIKINEHILQGARSHHMEKVTIIIKWWMRDTMRWHRKRKKKSWIKIRSSLENDNGKGQMKSIYIRTHVSTKRCKGKMWDNILNDFNGFSIVWHFVEFDFAFFRMATTGGLIRALMMFLSSESNRLQHFTVNLEKSARKKSRKNRY